MSRPPVPFPPPEEGLRLHLRLREDDPVAPADICQRYVPPLCAWLAQQFPTVDPHFRQSAVHEAVITYLQRPQAYQPERADLAVYLRLAARRDLSNLRRGEGRHNRQRVPFAVVELGAEHGNLLGREQDPSRRLEHNEEAAAWQAVLASIRAGLAPAEERVLDLMLQGERSSRVFAEAIGLEGLPADEEARAVKRVKDRVKKRLEREGARHG
jgi:hypothetical protein